MKLRSDYIGVVDIGGSHIRTGAFSVISHKISSFNRIELSELLKQDDQNPHKDRLWLITRSIAKAVNSLILKYGIQDVVIAFPGPIDKKGVARAAPTLLGGENSDIPVLSIFKNCLPNTQLWILNEVSAAGYGIVAQGVMDFLVITVSSGIGTKLFTEGKPQLGQNYRGGELGHLRVDFSEQANICDCGKRGHLGATSSGRSTPFYLGQKKETIDYNWRSTEGYDNSIESNLKLVSALEQNETWATDILDKQAFFIAWICAAAHLLTGVERFFLIGGYARALGNALLQSISHQAEMMCWENGMDWKSAISFTDETDEAVLIGAGIYWLLEHGEAKPLCK